MSSVFNSFYNNYKSFEPVNLYNWSIEFILDNNAFEFMDNRGYIDNNDGSVSNGISNYSRRYTWEEQSNILSFMCKKCNLPKKKISEVNTYCRGMQASFNAGITIDSSLSLSFDESSSRIVSRILTNLSNFYSNTEFIRLSIENKEYASYSCLHKASLANARGIMVGGHKGKNLLKYDINDSGKYYKDGDYNNRDLTIKVKLYHNKYGYLKPADIYDDERPLREFTFYKCFINSLKYGDGFEYGSEENLSIDCEIIYNWYTCDDDIYTKNKRLAQEDMQGYRPNVGGGGPEEEHNYDRSFRPNFDEESEESEGPSNYPYRNDV